MILLKLKTMKNKFYTHIQTLQNQICSGLEAVEGKAKFKEDLWERPEGVLEDIIYFGLLKSDYKI
jgi:coproporphyrinogen III oxidase